MYPALAEARVLKAKLDSIMDDGSHVPNTTSVKKQTQSAPATPVTLKSCQKLTRVELQKVQKKLLLVDK